jgi:hypothetical protein
MIDITIHNPLKAQASTSSNNTVACGAYTVADLAVGELVATVWGVDPVTKHLVYGKKAVPFRRMGGGAQIGTITDLVALFSSNAIVTGATFNLAISGNQVGVSVTGKTALPMLWFSVIEIQVVVSS